MNVKADIQDDDRRKALDEFASASRVPNLPMAPSVTPMAAIADRVFGAQKVAVYRDEARVLQRLGQLGAAAGDDWFYRYPVRNRKQNSTDWIEGASIKLANDVARIYGNCEVDTRVFDLGDTWLIYARFTDFETGYSLTRPFQQQKGAGKIGGDDGARRLDIAFQIGVSKAIRNVVVNALQTYADYAFDSARNSLVSKIGSSLDKYRERTIQGLANIPVELSRVERVIGRPTASWLAPDIARVIAMMKAIADGMASVDETFPAPERQVSTDSEGDQSDRVDQFANRSDQTAAESPSSSASQPAPETKQEPSGPAAAATGAGAAGAAEPGADASKATKATKADKATDKNDELVPTTEAQWSAYANAFIAKLTDAPAGEKWWKEGKNLRNRCNVSEETRDEVKKRFDEKIRQLQAPTAS